MTSSYRRNFDSDLDKTREKKLYRVFVTMKTRRVSMWGAGLFFLKKKKEIIEN